MKYSESTAVCRAASISQDVFHGGFTPGKSQAGLHKRETLHVRQGRIESPEDMRASLAQSLAGTV